MVLALPVPNVRIPNGRSGAGCSKHCYLNELVKRSTHYVFYDCITRYIDIFVEKMREAFALQKLLTFFQQKILENLRY